MLAVAIETSTRAPSVAVSVSGARGSAIESAPLAGERPHASDLLPALAALLARRGASPAAIELVVAGLGPGSYMGLRVGIATALGLARGSGARLCGLPSTEALAWERCGAGERASVGLEARRGELYFARYERSADDVIALVPPCLVKPAELELAAGDRVFATGGLAAPALERCSELLDPTPSAAALLELALQRLEHGALPATTELEPLYLRAFSAHPR
jgi:tRNA threonylcarbamoyladenosine biosynthesis protein TsaB